MYSFLHQTVQELLAAVHMSRMPPEDQLETFHAFITKPMFAEVIQFYAGITSLKHNGIIDILRERLRCSMVIKDHINTLAEIAHQRAKKGFIIRPALGLNEEVVGKTVDFKQLIPPDASNYDPICEAMLLSLSGNLTSMEMPVEVSNMSNLKFTE